jgi:hypothetical protein
MKFAYMGLVLLAACASPAQIAERQLQQQMEQESIRTAYRQRLVSSCESSGYQRDTEPWRQCIMKLDAQNQRIQTALGSALLQGYANQPRQIPPCRNLPEPIAGHQGAPGQLSLKLAVNLVTLE